MLLAIGNLRSPYDQPYREDLKKAPKATRSALAIMPHGNLATKEGELSDDPHAPPLAVLQGSDYADYWCTAVGLSSRGEVRRVEDFLAQYNLCLAPVSFDVKIVTELGGSPT